MKTLRGEGCVIKDAMSPSPHRHVNKLTRAANRLLLPIASRIREQVIVRVQRLRLLFQYRCFAKHISQAQIILLRGRRA